MKYNPKILLFLAVFLSSTIFSCAQLVKVPVDAYKLVENKEQFVNQPLSSLLQQVKPKILFCIGNPTDTSFYNSGPYLKFFFVNKDTYLQRRDSKTEKPIGVSVSLWPDKEKLRKDIPAGGVDITKEELIKRYGDMRIRSIYVNGKD